jgi:AcrR family transcriptional regulator
MPQVQKAEVRARIVAAATASFAERGFVGATMGDIAARAELSTGNVYRYFRGKDALFDAVIDDAFVARFSQLLEARVASLTGLAVVSELDPEARQRQAELLAFWCTHRLRVVILLDRCEGTRHAGYGARFVERLVALTEQHLERRAGAPLPEHTRFVLQPIFDGTRRTLVSILSSWSTEADIRAAFAAFWSFQLAGLAGLEQGVHP